MRFLLFFCTFSVLPIFAAGPIEFGARIGLPLTDVIKSSDNPGTLLNTETRRYIFGPSVELKLPFRLSVEADALFQRFSFRSGLLSAAGSTFTAFSDATSNQWEFPIMAKYKFTGGSVRPYVGAGASFRRVTNIGRLTDFVAGSNPGNDVGTGFVAAGGVQFRLFLIKLSPEVRFTRWGENNFLDGFGNVFRTTRSQGEFLIGITF